MGQGRTEAPEQTEDIPNVHVLYLDLQQSPRGMLHTVLTNLSFLPKFIPKSTLAGASQNKRRPTGSEEQQLAPGAACLIYSHMMSVCAGSAGVEASRLVLPRGL